MDILQSTNFPLKLIRTFFSDVLWVPEFETIHRRVQFQFNQKSNVDLNCDKPGIIIFPEHLIFLSTKLSRILLKILDFFYQFLFCSARENIQQLNINSKYLNMYQLSNPTVTNSTATISRQSLDQIQTGFRLDYYRLEQF